MYLLISNIACLVPLIVGDKSSLEAEIIQLKDEIEKVKKDNLSLRKTVDGLNETVRQILAKVSLLVLNFD